jgi:hypothetical protein
MAERDELGRTLGLARKALRGPQAMKERLRAQLAGGALAARVPDASASVGLLASGRRLLARRYHLATVTLLVGAGFGAGFWLGQLPPGGLQEDRAGSVTSAAPPPAALDAPELGSSRGALASAAALPTYGLASAGATGAPEATSASNPEPPRAAHDAAARATTSVTSTSPATRRRPETRAARAASDDALLREVALLERVDRAIRAGEGGLAAALLDELDRSVPAPALRHERAAARVLARCVIARDGSSSAQQQAHANAERLLAQDPTSVYADRIRAACALDGESTNPRTGIEEPFRVGH